MSQIQGRIQIYFRSIVVFLVGLSILGVLLYEDRNNQLSNFLRSWGWIGVVMAIFLMMVLCMTPIPSEGLLIMYLKIYGVGWGIFYAWIGSTLSTFFIYFIAQHFGTPMLKRIVSDERLAQISDWVDRRGSVGLFFARLLPIPAFVVNYTAGVVPSIQLWGYLWTGALSILPYYLGAALMYFGIMTNWLWIVIGFIPLMLVGIAGYMIRQRTKKW